MAMRPTKRFSNDVAFANVFADLAQTRELARRLQADGLRVWFDGSDQADLNKSSAEQSARYESLINDRLQASRTQILVMSKAAFGSSWPALEKQTRLFRDPASPGRQFIPLRVDDSSIPRQLINFAYIDWREQAETEYARLVASCRPSDERDEDLRAPRYTILPHSNETVDLLISKDEKILYSASRKEISTWNFDKGLKLSTVRTHFPAAASVLLLTDSTYAVSDSEGARLEVWDMQAGVKRQSFKAKKGSFLNFLVASDRRRVVSVRPEGLVVMNVESGSLESTNLETGDVLGTVLSKNGERLVCCSKDGLLTVWDIKAGLREDLDFLQLPVSALAVNQNGLSAVTGFADGTVKLWDLEQNRCLLTMEGHLGAITCLAMTPDGHAAVSGSADQTVRVWSLPTGSCVATIKGPAVGPVTRVTVGNSGSHGAYATADGRISLWDVSDLRSQEFDLSLAARYTNAKVLLVGETGVGKSSLAHRLTSGEFTLAASTHGAWATQMKLGDDSPGALDSQREVWLWDFAGQSDYRLIHQLFFDETALAIFVFNPQSEDPFDGLGQWERDITRSARRRFQKLLVAGRCDRGGLLVSRKALDQFIVERGFAQYLETSALTGEGCADLRSAITKHVRWEDLPWTSSPRLFKILKDAILQIKDSSDAPESTVLLRFGELKQRMQLILPQESFTKEDLSTVLALLAGPGVLWRLDFGDFILLQPERINGYAAALIRTVRAHVDEIGVISEDAVLRGELDYQDMDRLPEGEEEIVLRAMHQTFVTRSICLREPTESGTVLVFPSHFRRERPDLQAHPTPFVSYRFSGPLEEIYASLVVRIHYTTAFEKDQLWRFAADFRTNEGKRAGFKMVKLGEGRAEITVYFDREVPDDTKVTFVRYVNDHLRAKDPEVQRERHYACPYCGMAVENRSAVEKRLQRGETDIACSDCEKRVPLIDLVELKFASDEIRLRARQLREQASQVIDNQSRELILVGQAFAVTGEAGQIFRPIANSDWGIDGEIEFKDARGRASGRRLYLQLKSGDSYLRQRKSDGAEIFTIRNPRHARYWRDQSYPVMLVIRRSDGVIRWMNVTTYLKNETAKRSATTKTVAASKLRPMAASQIVFKGELFNAVNLLRLRDELFDSDS